MIDKDRVTGFVDQFYKLARTPWFATLANALGVFAGLLGAIYTDDVKRAWPFQWTHLESLSLHALLFWSCFLFFGITFLSRERSVEKTRLESEKNLQEAINTMPPRGLILEFAEYFSECNRAVHAFDAGSPTKEQCEALIRVLLSSIANLAQRYDAASNKIYATNVMLYFDNVAQWQGYYGVSTEPEIMFAEFEAARDRLPLLVIDKNLSASTTNKNSASGDLDPALTNIPVIALSVPITSNRGRTADGRRWRVLPGAPLTFVTGDANTYEDTDNLGRWCRERGDFSESVNSAVEEYFGKDAVRKNIRSLASMPLIPSLGKTPIGVVNLHADRTGVLSDQGTVSQFFPLAQPFTAFIADIVLRMRKIAP